jgi:hypothetical protein
VAALFRFVSDSHGKKSATALWGLTFRRDKSPASTNSEGTP